jgi:hypothetical protein
MCLLIVDSDGSLSIDCVNCSQKFVHISISPENVSSLMGANIFVADVLIGAAAYTASRASVIMIFAVERASNFST